MCSPQNVSTVCAAYRKGIASTKERDLETACEHAKAHKNFRREIREIRTFALVVREVCTTFCWICRSQGYAVKIKQQIATFLRGN